MSDLVENPEDQFSRVEAQIMSCSLSLFTPTLIGLSRFIRTGLYFMKCNDYSMK